MEYQFKECDECKGSSPSDFCAGCRNNFLVINESNTVLSKVNIFQINHLLHVDGIGVRALDVIDQVSKETLVKILTYIVQVLE